MRASLPARPEEHPVFRTKRSRRVDFSTPARPSACSGPTKGKTCKAGAKQGRKCTGISKVASYELGVGGSSTVALPKKKLAAGDYRAVATQVDAAGNTGAAKTVSFKVLEK
jgi:hypothetical protein